MAAAACLLAAPERDHGRRSGSRRHQNAIRLDLLQPPGVGAQQKRIAHAAFVHKLLIELAQADAVARVNPILAGIRDGAAVDQSQPLTPRQGAEPIVNTIPTDARLQHHRPMARGGRERGSAERWSAGQIALPRSCARALREAAADHFQHSFESLGGQTSEWISAANQGVERAHVPVFHRDHGHHLLGKHVQAVARDTQLLDPAGGHLRCQHCLLQEIAQGLWNEAAFALAADQMSGPAHALQAPRHIPRRLDLTDQVYRAHVNAKLKRCRGHHAAQLAFLQGLFGFQPDFQGHAAVVGPHEGRERARERGARFCARALRRSPALRIIQVCRDALDAAPIVGEDDGRAMPADLLGEQTINGRPDRFFRQRAELLHRADYAQIKSLAHARIDHGDRTLATGIGESAEIAGYFIQGPLCGGEADADKPARVQGFQAFQEKRQENAALVGTEGVNLVDDAVTDPAQGFASTGGQEQVQRFRRGDENMGRLAQEPLPFHLRSIAGADGNVDFRQWLLEAPGKIRNAFQGNLQIAIDVVIERFQRRYVQDLHSGGNRILPPQSVKAGKERGQGLARSGRRQDEGILAGSNGRPTLPLRRRRPSQGMAKPLPDRRQE